MKQDEALSDDELNEESHRFNKRSKLCSNCSQFIDSEGQESDGSDNDIDEEFDIFDSEWSLFYIPCYAYIDFTIKY